ncbi:unnamed protein product [Mycena citricolor]|uniref:F-box domain-containing protein n=1 Tax=Mycena citricolor TaxID=2018698 RepID=A0AAD2K037_9AGAR|nr:unnamed protein product [Mycena citricolor]
MVGTDIHLRLREISDTLCSLERQLVALRSEQQTLLVSLRHPTPIRSLPGELIGEIFQWCLAGGSGSGFSNSRPMQLASVCRAWRDAALGTPQLWTDINVSPFVKRPAKLDRLVDVSLQRGGALGADLRASFGVAQVPPPSRFINVLQAAARHPHRWRSFEFQSFDVTGPLDVLDEIVWSYLEVLALQGNPTQNFPPAITVFRNAPLLRTVELDGLCAAHLSLPWTQIQSLDLNNILVSQCLDILEQTPGLKTLVADIYSRERVTLPHITLPELTFYHGSDNEDFTLIEHLILPVLQHLRVTHLEHVPALLERSGCHTTLQSLTIEFPPSMYDLELIPALPCLKHLAIEQAVFAETIEFCHFVSEFRTGQLKTVPALETFVLRGCSIPSFNLSVATRMVADRFQDGAGCLKSFKVEFSMQGREAAALARTVEELRELKHRGLDLSFGLVDEKLHAPEFYQVTADLVAAMSI